MSRSQILLEQASRVIPGGVNSPVRAFAAVKGDPPFITRGEGAYLFDADGHRYLDLVGSWGPLILGHAPEPVVRAIETAARSGTSFGAPTEGEVRFAEELCAAHPALDMVRLCSSGTEATMHAIRLARGFTGRDHVIKLDGCYHGAHDGMLVAAGSGVATFARPGSPGIPQATAALTLTAPFGDLDAVAHHLRTHEVACLILEPVPGNMGCLPPKPGYLEGLRDLCTKAGALLIFDEVMSGFRLALGGATERFGVMPDLVTMGKVVGGGLPLAAFGGRGDIMARLSPSGPVYQAGTLSGNPLAVAAGRATLALLTPQVYAHLEALGARLESGLKSTLQARGMSMTRLGSMFTIFFRSEVPSHFEEVKECDLAAFGQFHRTALEQGVYLPPSQFEAAFLSVVVTNAEIDGLVEQLKSALQAL